MRAPRLAIAAALSLCSPLAASAHNWSYGFAWANSPTSPSYTPYSHYAYSDVGTPPRIERSATGKYSVRFPGLDSVNALEANLQVTAYGSDAAHCKPQGWGGDAVTVSCFDADGDTVDARFSVLFLEADDAGHTGPAMAWDVGRYAFALADQPTNSSYTPDPDYASNPGGGAITATRSGAGTYSISFAGMSALGSGGGHVQVTAVGVGATRCRLQSWGAEIVHVRCFGASGAPADSAYSVLYWRTDVADPGIAYAWADLPTTASYTPAAAYAFDAGGGAIEAERVSTGSYRITWPGMFDLGVNGGNVQVTAYGGAADANCKVGDWGASNATVRCFDAAGNPVDSRYTALFLKTPKKPWAREYAFARANLPSEALYHPTQSWSYNEPMGLDRQAPPFAPRTDISISRLDTGIYNVHFEGFRAHPGGGNVQVSNGSLARHCKVSSWQAEDVGVRCFDSSGTPSDAIYSVFYLKTRSQPTSVAFAWANQETSSSYTPSASYAYNPAGEPITATRTDVGRYTMTWSGFGALGLDGGHAQVTAYGATNSRCQIQGWADDLVQVRCFDGAGNLADSRYSVLYVRPEAEDDGLAFAFSDQHLSTEPFYEPAPFYSFDHDDYGIVAWRLELGTYGVVFQNYSWRGYGMGGGLVSAYGNADRRCARSSASDISVSCVDPAGNDADTKWNGMLVKPVAVPEPGHVSLLASGVALLALIARRRAVRPR